ncbi:phospholipase A2-like [Pseudorasbora parva]|uniref:phospholipase A2-like n=1 Tax=Pseudorasbora parva TaxID=51549 RepID=UPI00351ED040
MHVHLALLILTVTLPPSHLYNMKNLLQFKNMIECIIPNSSALNFADYGCYCGFGGQGSPVDQLDRCCFTHDNCYAKAETLESCTSLFDSPYTNIYDYQCDKNTRTITCLGSNNDCNMFICKCDKAAAECFAQSPYNASNNHLPSSVCSSSSREISSFITTLVAFIVTLTILYGNKISCSQ